MADSSSTWTPPKSSRSDEEKRFAERRRQMRQLDMPLEEYLKAEKDGSSKLYKIDQEVLQNDSLLSKISNSLRDHNEARGVREQDDFIVARTFLRDELVNQRKFREHRDLCRQPVWGHDGRMHLRNPGNTRTMHAIQSNMFMEPYARALAVRRGEIFPADPYMHKDLRQKQAGERS
mmetsp:Transcript_15664/g.40049  ORF Transcript_15664/g.40049 Transcript_15664/m.40049 type:complete len:176 (+) Transcript_15664:176-703(+)|eukprot:CAMPEP_0177656896 /NCGR_PEP_ID=MMETSP0447-20121125/15857_1 /TAXON_ID=0 /ORGANISM="Stygamoeba regulata, Strain BSH-02190019" /LENGTH=175 /DNA_ID=CAMNT_0019161137 /DNA_START=150 /DNA_END=677 /DNA_ORIENTATION=+